MRGKGSGIPEEKYNMLLVVFSTWFDKRNHKGLFNMLKCIYSDLLDNATYSNVESTIDMLQALGAAGRLNSRNLTLLHDTINITKQVGLIVELKRVWPSFPEVEGVSSLSHYRQKVLSFFASLSDGDVKIINKRFNNPTKRYSDRWDMLFDLEKCRSKINEENLIECIEDLKKIGLEAAVPKVTRKRKPVETLEESDEEGSSATPKRSRKRKAVETVEWSDEESNSDSGSKNESETKSKKQMKQIMISYKTTHQVTVKQIVKRLEEKLKETHTIWIDYREINDDIMRDIEKGIKESDIALICLSKEYETSRYCKKECEIIQDNDMPFIPLMLEEYEPEDKNSKVQLLIKGKLWVDFRDDTMFTETNYDKLVKRIKKIEKK